jgi:PKD repeat protein
MTAFAPDEGCTVILFAGAIRDVDNDDPPDVMEKDYTWFFHIAQADPPPVAGFTSNSPIWLGQEVHFTNTTTGSGAITFIWDFGDGSAPSTAIHPSHLYTAAGRYLVTLTATGKGTATAIGEVEVLAYQMYLPLLAR